MSQDLISEAMNIFDSFEKWEAFLTLYDSRDELKRRYYQDFKRDLNKHFGKNNVNNWSFSAPYNEQFRWYLTSLTQESICILWYVDGLVLWANPSNFNLPLAKDLLSTPEYSAILDCFENLDSLSMPHAHHLVEEKHRYSFHNNSIVYDGTVESNLYKLGWLARSRSSELITQLEKKIARFQTTEITDLLLELNKKCKKM